MDFVCKIGGQAGAGVMVASRLMVKCFTRGGYHAIAYPEYPSLIRGGHNSVQIRVADGKIHAPLQEIDLLVALNKDALFYHMSSMAEGGVIIYDKLIDASKFKVKKGVKMHALPLLDLTKEVGGTEQMKNTTALGAALAAVEYPLDVLAGIMQDEFGRKGEAVVKKNMDAAKAGYDFVKSNSMHCKKALKPLSDERKVIITGNEAISLGAVAGGMKFYSAYPMTPASSILHYLIANERSLDIVTKQTEDEIAAINYAIGASFAGARAMVGTSGGGFALMVEALGMAALAEVPIVVSLVQRVGPSTGMPTWTEQADLRFALHASQGDFPRIILAPGDIDECFYMSAEAFNLAERYQVPVIIISDKYLSESVFTTERFDMKRVKIDRGKIASGLPELAPMARWKRYELTKDGVSPRVFPGTPNGLHVGTSYEHDETGFSTESFIMRTKQVQKRAKKAASILKEMEGPQLHGPKSADVTLVGWGSTKLSALDALPLLQRAGIKANYLHFSHLFPLDEKEVQKAFAGKRNLIMLEGNSTAQFAGMLKQYAGLEMDFHLLKYDGRPFFPEQIAEEVAKLKKAGLKGPKERTVVEKEDLEYYNPQR
ncbi:MAG: 2-oxoacid:acceptor oxidoreductase subunit alpha, partial [Candidatus Micrarchaeota archaeon]